MNAANRDFEMRLATHRACIIALKERNRDLQAAVRELSADLLYARKQNRQLLRVISRLRRELRCKECSSAKGR